MRRASTDALESLQPSQLLPVGAGHDYRRRTYDCLFIMQLVGQVPAALWVISARTASLEPRR